MSWPTLLSGARIDCKGNETGSSTPPGERTPFERDWDRIVFSESFRRLNLKTQVFPFPELDAVHTRLTHSLEVAAVGRSLGNRAADVLMGAGAIAEPQAALVGSVVAAACLMHDIGNPPFGHSGEDSIQEWFRSHRNELESRGASQSLLDDMEAFNGNAQGLRVVMRLEMEERGGMRLTAATVATFMKYPSSVYSKKRGIFSSEREGYGGVARSCGLPEVGDGFARHPLNPLMEAADDISYVLLDLEDGVHLGLVDVDLASELLASFIDAVNAEGIEAPGATNPPSDPMSRLAYFRAIATASAIAVAMQSYSSLLADILEFRRTPSLLEAAPQPVKDAFHEVLTLTIDRCYRSDQVLALEVLGHEVITYMLDTLVPLAFHDLDTMSSPQRALFAIHLKRYRPLWARWDIDERIRRIVDYVVSMTDRQILYLYRRGRGIASPPSWL